MPPFYSNNNQQHTPSHHLSRAFTTPSGFGYPQNIVNVRAASICVDRVGAAVISKKRSRHLASMALVVWLSSFSMAAALPQARVGLGSKGASSLRGEGATSKPHRQRKGVQLKALPSWTSLMPASSAM